MAVDDIEFFQSTPLNPNDDKLISDLKYGPLPDNGKKVAEMRNLSVEDLAKLNEEHGDRTLIHHLAPEQREQVEEYLHQNGIEPPRTKKYFY